LTDTDCREHSTIIYNGILGPGLHRVYIVHNVNSRGCGICHDSSDSLIQGLVSSTEVARAGDHRIHSIVGTGRGTKVSSTIYYNELNLTQTSITVNTPQTEVVSPEWTPGPGYEIKRVKVDGWKPADRQAILAYVDGENKWFTLPVADEAWLPSEAGLGKALWSDRKTVNQQNCPTRARRLMVPGY